MQVVMEYTSEGVTYKAEPSFRGIVLEIFHPVFSYHQTGDCLGCAHDGMDFNQIKRCGSSPGCDGSERDGQNIIWVRKGLGKSYNMDKKAEQALRQSIQHWKENLERAEGDRVSKIDTSARSCALCNMFFESGCQGCPVSCQTGKDCCNGTPYIRARETIREYLSLPLDRRHHELPAIVKAVKDEIQFLESLLPVPMVSEVTNDGAIQEKQDLNSWVTSLFNSADHSVAENPIIPKDTTTCRECNEELTDTRIDKLMDPPFRIMFCPKCDLQYWRCSK